MTIKRSPASTGPIGETKGAISATSTTEAPEIPFLKKLPYFFCTVGKPSAQLLFVKSKL